MHQELVALEIELQHVVKPLYSSTLSKSVSSTTTKEVSTKAYKEIITELFVAPSYIVKSLAEFLTTRDEDETFVVKGKKVNFVDCSVTVGDSKKAVAAYECLRHYNMPLGNYTICSDLLQDSKNPGCNWVSDENFSVFSKWFTSRDEGDDQNV